MIYQDIDVFIHKKLNVPENFERNAYSPSAAKNFYAEYRAEFKLIIREGNTIVRLLK
jgi:hypothetical protein